MHTFWDAEGDHKEGREKASSKCLCPQSKECGTTRVTETSTFNPEFVFKRSVTTFGSMHNDWTCSDHSQEKQNKAQTSQPSFIGKHVLFLRGSMNAQKVIFSRLCKNCSSWKTGAALDHTRVELCTGPACCALKYPHPPTPSTHTHAYTQ